MCVVLPGCMRWWHPALCATLSRSAPHTAHRTAPSLPCCRKLLGCHPNPVSLTPHHPLHFSVPIHATTRNTTQFATHTHTHIHTLGGLSFRFFTHTHTHTHTNTHTHAHTRQECQTKSQFGAARNFVPCGHLLYLERRKPAALEPACGVCCSCNLCLLDTHYKDYKYACR